MKKIKIFIGSVALLAIAAVAMTPLFLSSDWVKNIVVNKVNSGLSKNSGNLSLGGCEIGWVRGLICTDISYRDAAQGYRLDVTRLSGTQGLFSLIRYPKNFGTITVDDPVLVFDQASAKLPAVSQNTSESKKGNERDAKNTGAKSTPDATVLAKADEGKQKGTWFWHKMGGNLLLNRAIVKLNQADKEPSVLLDQGFIDALLAADTLNFELSLETEAENGKGEAKAIGVVKLPSVKQGNLLDVLTAEMQLILIDLQTEPFLALAPKNASIPKGQGKLSADLTVKSTEGGGLTVRGPITLADVDLTGGFFAEDHPRVDQLALELDLQRDTLKNWFIPELKMISDFGTLDLQSGEGDQGIQIKGAGKIDLPVLLTQFPHLLKVQEDLRLESGLVTITVDLSKEQEILHVVADAVVEDLAGRQNQQPFSWDSLLSLSFNGSMIGNEPEVKKLSLKASFLDIEGKGNLNTFSLNGSADLDQAVREISRIIQFDWDMGGKLKLALDSEKQPGKNGEDRYAVSTRIDIADCQFTRQGKTLLPAHRILFNGKLHTPAHFPKAKADAVDLTFDISSWAGEISGSVDGLYREQGHVMAHYQVSWDLLLARVTELLHNYELIEQQTSVAGSMKLRASGYTEKDRLVLTELDTRVKDFILYRQGKIFQEPDLHLFTSKPTVASKMENAVRPLEEADSKDIFFAEGGGYNLIDTLKHRLVLRDLSLISGFADIKADRIFLEDWKHKPAPAVKELRVSGRSNLEKLAILLQQLGMIQPEQKFGGDAVFALDLTGKKDEVEIAGKTGGGNSGTIKLDLKQFTYSVDDTRKGRKEKEQLLVERQKLVFRSHLHGDLMAGDLQFTTFDVESAPLSMQSGGELHLSGKKRYFSLDGHATPDLASLVAIINGMYPLDLEIVGKKKEKFSLYYPLSPDKKETAKINLRFATSVYADSFSKAGIDISKLSVDTEMKDGILVFSLKGALNQGWVQISPRIDYTRTPPLLTLAKAEQVLTDVQLEQALTDKLLKVLHPIFGTLATPSGAINARMEQFSLPLGKKGLERINFKVFLDLNGIVLQAKGVLSNILEMAGYTERSLTLKNKNITCEGVKGKITCSPIKITVADSELIISGSAGIDGSLDYVVDVPVTKRLLGKKGYEMLKGTTLKVPVKGSRGKPVYSREAMMQASSDLLKQAAGQSTRNVIKEQADRAVPGLKGVPELLDGLFAK